MGKGDGRWEGGRGEGRIRIRLGFLTKRVGVTKHIFV